MASVGTALWGDGMGTAWLVWGQHGGGHGGTVT